MKIIGYLKMIRIILLFLIMSFNYLIAQDGGLQHSASAIGRAGFDDVPTILKNKSRCFF